MIEILLPIGTYVATWVSERESDTLNFSRQIIVYKKGTHVVFFNYTKRIDLESAIRGQPILTSQGIVIWSCWFEEKKIVGGTGALAHGAFSRTFP